MADIRLKIDATEGDWNAYRRWIALEMPGGIIAQKNYEDTAAYCGHVRWPTSEDVRSFMAAFVAAHSRVF